MVQIIQSGPSQETLRQQAMNDALQGIVQGYAGYEKNKKSDLLTQRQQALADNQTKLKLMEIGIANPDQALSQLKGEYKQTEIAPAQPAQFGKELAGPVMPGQSPLKELLSAAVPAQMSPANPLETYTEAKKAKIASDLAMQQQNEALKKAQVDMIPLDRQKKEAEIQKIQDDVKLRPLEKQAKLADIEWKHSQAAQKTDEKTDKRFGDFAKIVANPTTRSALGNFGKNLASADRIKVLTDSYAGGLKHGSPEEIAALNQLTSTQSEEVTKSLDSLLSGGSSTISGAESLRFKTLASEWSDLKAKYLNDPKGANLGAFLSRALDTVDREREYNAKQVDRVIGGLGEGFSDLRKKDQARFQNIIGSAYTRNESPLQATTNGSAGGSPWLKYGAKK